MAALISKPGITSASTLSIPKDWDSTWFRSFIQNQLKGADVRNAIGTGGVVVSGNISSPYATISLGGPGPVTLNGQVTIATGAGPNALVVNGPTVMNGSLSVNSQGGVSIFGPANTQDNILSFGQTGQSTWQIYTVTSTNNIALYNNGYGNVITLNGNGDVNFTGRVLVGSGNLDSQFQVIRGTQGVNAQLRIGYAGGDNNYMDGSSHNFRAGDATAWMVISGGNVSLPNASTYTSAAAGTSSALPANPVGYMRIDVGGVARKFPFYA